MRQHPAIVDPRRWRRLRHWIVNIRDNRRCQACGRVAGRAELDHIQRIEDGGSWWDPSNLQTLDRACHFSKTARENARPVSPEAQAWRDLVAELVNKST